MMKNTFKTGIYIMAFALGIFFQISCSNDDAASVISDNEKFVFVVRDFANTDLQSIWIANIGGSDKTQIPITLPAGFKFYTIYGTNLQEVAAFDANVGVFL